MKFRLGKAYLGGEQVSVDPALGRDWLELAANGGTTKTLFELAELQHKQGELEQARASYAKAAKQGHILPQYTYGEILRLGQGGTRRLSSSIVWRPNKATTSHNTGWGHCVKKASGLLVTEYMLTPGSH